MTTVNPARTPNSTRADAIGRWALVIATLATGLFTALIWTFAVAKDPAGRG